MLNQYARWYLSHTQVFCWKFQKPDTKPRTGPFYSTQKSLNGKLVTRLYCVSYYRHSQLRVICPRRNNYTVCLMRHITVTICFYLITSSGDVVNNYSCSKTGDVHVKLVGGNIKAGMRRYSSFNTYESSGWISCHTRLKMLSDKLTKGYKTTCKAQITGRQRIILENISLYLGHLLLASMSSVSSLCEETGFFFGQASTVSCICPASWTPYKQQQSMISCLMDKEQEISPG